MSETYSIKAPELDIPFTGGAVGYLSYDLMPLIEPSLPIFTAFKPCIVDEMQLFQFVIISDHRPADKQEAFCHFRFFAVPFDGRFNERH